MSPSSGEFHAAPSQVAPLFLLPNIKKLDLSLWRHREPSPEIHLPPSSSSVEELTFDSCEICSEAFEKLVLAPRGLKRLRCNFDSAFTKRLTGQLAERYASTLEALLVYGDHSEIDIACLKKFGKLAFVEGVELSSFSICATHSSAFPESACGCATADLRTILPFSLQYLGIQDFSPNWYDGVLEYGGRNLDKDTLNAIVHLAEDNRFKHLRQICLWGIKLGNEYDEALMRIKDTALSLSQGRKYDGKLRDDDYLVKRSAAMGNDFAKIETDPSQDELTFGI
ncbi:hypothetical protein KC332_g5935 [Hortaea werneckii]|nr:hypothetical protein KC358_g1369 [Hortaea werneckii]KAI6852091.1 hypothetical protein KC350_g1196 [Hortaea werneckii]KAI6936769.1 hypothetical protein KC348_g5909 [Hortaea werneckii]KAI6937341.1 hypothetical protein KC341_g5649 [Hortaea werneckii]KAI6972948.1 hypothetical protein KC321_g5956 [Hortaea werneckii]